MIALAVGVSHLQVLPGTIAVTWAVPYGGKPELEEKSGEYPSPPGITPSREMANSKPLSFTVRFSVSDGVQDLRGENPKHPESRWECARTDCPKIR